MNQPITISPLEASDTSSWLTMRAYLWPENSEEEHKREIEQFYSKELTHAESIAAHHSLGFRDAGLIHCFVKEI